MSAHNPAASAQVFISAAPLSQIFPKLYRMFYEGSLWQKKLCFNDYCLNGTHTFSPASLKAVGCERAEGWRVDGWPGHGSSCWFPIVWYKLWLFKTLLAMVNAHNRMFINDLTYIFTDTRLKKCPNKNAENLHIMLTWYLAIEEV